jgi:hypothetical protein
LYSNPIEFEEAVKMCLNETYSKAHADEHLYDTSIKNGTKQ